jgi:serine/threonine protein kinase
MAFVRSDFDDWRMLGEGGEARVFRAWEKARNRVVAIRELKPHAVAAAQQAAAALAPLRHPGLAALHDFGPADKHFYWVQDYAPGLSLAQLGKLDAQLALTLLRTLARTLAYLHGQGLAHGDLHPGNVQVVSATQCVLMDLGSVRPLGAPMSRVLGAVRYLSPEHGTGAAVDARSDIFSCGALLYYMLSGQDLFEARHYTEQATVLQKLSTTESRQALAQRWRDLPAEAWQLLDRCLRAEPSARWEDMDEFDEQLEIALQKLQARYGLKALRAAQETLAAQLTQLPDPPSAEKHTVETSVAFTRNRSGRWIVAAAAVLVALGALAWWKKTPPPNPALDRIGVGLLADARLESSVSHGTDSLRTIVIPNLELFAEIIVDDTPLSTASETIRLVPGAHQFRGRWHGAQTWRTATLQVPATGAALWTWDTNLVKTSALQNHE